MDKEKEIREMSNIFCNVDNEDEEDEFLCIECGYYEENAMEENCPYYSKGKALIKALHNAGYRKAEDVRKETAQAILQELYDITFERREPYSDSDAAKEVIDRAEILNTAKIYGVDIEEL